MDASRRASAQGYDVCPVSYYYFRWFIHNSNGQMDGHTYGRTYRRTGHLVDMRGHIEVEGLIDLIPSLGERHLFQCRKWQDIYGNVWMALWSRTTKTRDASTRLLVHPSILFPLLHSFFCLFTHSFPRK